jgi:hypothetical protein
MPAIGQKLPVVLCLQNEGRFKGVKTDNADILATGTVFGVEIVAGEFKAAMRPPN